MTATNTEQFALAFDASDPGLADLVRETARRLARERGAITSDDVWGALEADNPLAHARLKLRPKGINVAWTPRKDWRKTGEWRPLGSNGRHIACWCLSEQVAA